MGHEVRESAGTGQRGRVNRTIATASHVGTMLGRRALDAHHQREARKGCRPSDDQAQTTRSSQGIHSTSTHSTSTTLSTHLLLLLTPHTQTMHSCTPCTILILILLYSFTPFVMDHFVLEHNTYTRPLEFIVLVLVL